MQQLSAIPPICLYTDILTGVFSFLSRPQLDIISFTCRHIHQIIKSHYCDTPYRQLQDLLLHKSLQKDGEGQCTPNICFWTGETLKSSLFSTEKSTKARGVHISFTPSDSSWPWKKSVDELVEQILELSHLWRETCLFLSFNLFDSSKLEGSEKLLETLFRKIEHKNAPGMIQLELSDRNKDGEVKVKMDKYKILRACRTISLNLTDACFDAASLVTYLHGEKRKDQNIKLFVTNDVATQLIAMLKQCFLEAETCCFYQLSIYCITTNYDGMTSLAILNAHTQERLEMIRDSTSLYCPPYQITRFSSPS